MSAVRYSPEFKHKVVEEHLKAGKRVSEVCREYKLCETVFRRWLKLYRADQQAAAVSQETLGRELREAKQRIEELAAAVTLAQNAEQVHEEIDKLKALAAQAEAVTVERSASPLGTVSLARACELTGLSRSWYYERQHRTRRDETALQDEIELIVLEYPGYGYRRVTPELERRSWLVNHKRVLRIMREQSWLCRLARAGRQTTQSDHDLQVYPNLLKTVEITGLDQAWVADLTYIRLPLEFVYVAPILDAHSRKAVGWNLSR